MTSMPPLPPPPPGRPLVPRETVVDLKHPSPTGVWHLAKGRYGKRPKDKPYPWAYLVGYQTVMLLFKMAAVAGGALIAYWLQRRYGIPTP